MSDTEAVPTKVRLDGIDRLRGVAILLMVLDHVLVVVAHSYPHWTITVARGTVTRPSFILFGLIAGFMLARRKGPASNTLLLAGLWCAIWAAFFPTGLAAPDVLLLFALVLCVGGKVVLRAPALCGAIGVIQVFTWPLAIGNYEIGAVVALVALGVLAYRAPNSISAWQAAGVRLPEWLSVPGRRPVALYVGHLVGLSALTALL